MTQSQTVFILLLLLVARGAELTSYAHTMMLTEERYAKELTYTVPHIVNATVVFAIRDYDGIGKFSWWMHHSLTDINATHDCLTFEFGQDWPKGKLNSMVVDFIIFKSNPSITVIRKRAVDYQTHLETPMNKSKPSELLMFPVSFTDLSLTSGFTNMPIPEYNMFAIHYMHMHGSHHASEEDSARAFEGNWIEFMCVVIELPPIPSNLNCKLLNKWDTKSFQSTDINSECGYFAGLKSIYDYHSKEQFTLTSTTLEFKDYSQSNFGIMAFPSLREGFEDHRKYYLPLSAKAGMVGEEKVNIIIQTFNEFPLVLFILIASVFTTVGLIIYARCTIMRRRQGLITFRDDPSAPV